MIDFSTLKNKIKETEEWLSKECGQIRTGRATPTLLDEIKAEAYGSMMPINQLATIAGEDPRTLRIVPFDGSVSKAIEKAILVSGSGLSVSMDDKGLRVSVPALTEETRGQFVKIAKQKLEDAKITLRGERNKFNDDLQTKKKNSDISEDEMRRAQTEMEKLVKEASEKLEAQFKKKEAEIMN